MFRFPLLRLTLVAAAVSLFSVAAVPMASASSDFEHQNPSLSVYVSLASNGANHEATTVGNTVTLQLWVQNNSPTARTIGLRVTEVYPNYPGRTPDVISWSVPLGPHAASL